MPHRNALLPVLLVCRNFHDIVVPLLYESISTMHSFNFWPPSELAQPSTYVFPKRDHFKQLLEALTRNPALATHIETFIYHGTLYARIHEWESIREILPLLPRLRRLSLIPPVEPRAPLTVNSVFPTIRLTHLAFLNEWDKRVYNFIRSQPSLEYLALGGISVEATPLVPSLPTIQLPNLRNLDSRHCFFNRLDVTTPLEHLSIAATDDSVDNGKTPYELLRNVKSFICPAFMLAEFGPYCYRVEFLWVTVFSDIKIDDILSMSSRSLKYLRYPPSKHERTDCQKLFDAFPDLVIIDILLKVEGTSRYVRGSVEPVDAQLIGEVEFQNWHELLLDDIEAQEEEMKTVGV
ncbi:hypothetical protein ONZ45_g10619 [Pleurotus djamor]|nr:hypothetical protein ONZ45_g10619 [Pleurotus djamor]